MPNINFIPKDENVFTLAPHPKPSKNYIPEWFKQMPSTISDLDNKKMDYTAKACMPFIDSLVSGYTQELTCDIKINNHGIDDLTGLDILTFEWSGSIQPLSSREIDTRSRKVFPNFDGYYTTEFHWNSLWEPELPNGYSAFYFHPANRFDLPFITMNGIIDTDGWPITGPIPFLIKRGFSGIIPAGTPIYQILIIKREDWHSVKSEYNKSKQDKKIYSVRKYFNGGYKKLYWNRKNYG